MAGIDDVLERLVTDAGFRAQLARDPTGALVGYDLTADDLQLLSAQLDPAAGSSGAVEGRTSKAGLFGLLGGVDELAEAIGAGGDQTADSGRVDAADYVVWRKTDGAADGGADELAVASDTDAAAGEGFKREIELESYALGTPTTQGTAGAGDDLLVGGTTVFDEPASASPFSFGPGMGGVTPLAGDWDGHTAEEGGVNDAVHQLPGAGDSAPAAAGDLNAVEFRADPDPVPIVANDETITVHGGRTEDTGGVDAQDLSVWQANFGQDAAPADTHELEQVSFVYQEIDLESGDPAAVASAEPSEAEMDTSSVRVTSDAINAAGNTTGTPVGQPVNEALDVSHTGMLEGSDEAEPPAEDEA